jgi:hypothetical protein
VTGQLTFTLLKRYHSVVDTNCVVKQNKIFVIRTFILFHNLMLKHSGSLFFLCDVVNCISRTSCL